MGSDGPFGSGGPLGPGGPIGPGRGGRGRGRARRGDVRHALLALLTEGSANGYQLIQALNQKTNGLWKPSPGAVYPALSQLEDELLIEAFDNVGQRAFRLTHAGQDAAAEINPKPWEVLNADSAPEHPEATSGLWKEFRSLAMASQELTRSGSRSQQEQAAKVLAETRRRLYALLASDDDDPGISDPR
ncbi:MAG: helix-turn-helix transcriptional regulator [Micropruina sp.]|nr:helix-turn-helix transcriptional regulator [Micropruina sp.]